MKNTSVCSYFDGAKINCFLFLFGIFLEILKDMQNTSVSLCFEWTK